jgi:hypothetical protein
MTERIKKEAGERTCVHRLGWGKRLDRISSPEDIPGDPLAISPVSPPIGGDFHAGIKFIARDAEYGEAYDNEEGAAVPVVFEGGGSDEPATENGGAKEGGAKESCDFAELEKPLGYIHFMTLRVDFDC